MDIVESNCISRDKRNEVVVQLNNNKYSIRYKELSKETVYSLPLYYKEKLKQLSIQQNIPEKQVLEFLLDFYYLDNSRLINVLIKQLSNRLFQGVDRGFIIQLRTLYTMIGHFLKRLRYI